jgi:hypothetical protein
VLDILDQSEPKTISVTEFSRRRLGAVSKNAEQIDATFRKIKISEAFECPIREPILEREQKELVAPLELVLGAD